MKLKSVFSRRNRILLKELVSTDFKLRYQGSVLGYLWSVLKPLMLFAIMYIVFVRFMRFGEGIPHFAVSLLMGMVLWTFFLEASTQGMNSIVNRGDLIRKINFPKYIIVISGTISALINLVINMGVVLVFAIFNGVEFSWTALLVPVLVLEIYVFALGIAFLLGAINVKFRDIAYIWEVLMQGLFYATPIIYPLTKVAEFSVWAAKLLLINPIAQVIQDVRYCLIYSGTDTIWSFIENPVIRLIPIAIVILTVIFASWYFKKHSKKFSELV